MFDLNVAKDALFHEKLADSDTWQGRAPEKDDSHRLYRPAPSSTWEDCGVYQTGTAWRAENRLRQPIRKSVTSGAREATEERQRWDYSGLR
jgi:hypothetical protein